ncbi:MAG TPA: YceI family protein [Steroidobacteraceae bacterium]|nr:YceI family protein [Steroidobacteraceae bacterium]
MTQRTSSLQAALLSGLLATAALAQAPAGGTHFAADPAKSSLDFDFVQAGAQNKGKFAKFPVALDAAPDGSAVSRLDVTVEMSTLDSGDKERDDTLRGQDLFAVAKFPQAHFVATQITRTATGFDALGKLTLRGVTRDQHVPFTLRTANEQGHNVAYLSGKTVVHRLDFGVGQGDWKSTEWVGNDVTVAYSVRLVAQ